MTFKPDDLTSLIKNADNLESIERVLISAGLEHQPMPDICCMLRKITEGMFSQL